MKITGTALAVSALRTKKSCGSGEFLDLIPFADFCKKAGLKIIQLLPVNDTGTESSPYSALSAFALHPLYLRVEALPELTTEYTDISINEQKKSLLHKVKQIRDEYESLPRFPYKELRNAKLALEHEVYTTFCDQICKDKNLTQWIEENPWIKGYAVFMHQKTINLEASWKDWKKNQKITTAKVIKLWDTESLKTEHFFYAWLQMNLDIQFKTASEYLAKQNILLKGDIPIMMNEDSHDVWEHNTFFNKELRAGAPADGFNPYGQNWGFPTYNWKNMKKDNYSWWKNRLIQASKYYNMFRIDHILGFFRIWAIPQAECTAILGHTEPYEPITRDELYELGFNDERIRWLSLPHIPTTYINEVNCCNTESTHTELKKIMTQIGNEELWLFKPEITSDSDIWKRNDLSAPIKQRLAEKWRDRMFIEIEPNKFFTVWTYKDSTAWNSLSDNERYDMTEFLRQKQQKMNFLWEKQARTLLSALVNCTKMIPCAEDLGANIDSMPLVLNDLGIMSLRVVRWSRYWNEYGFPFVPFNKYPELSVTTTSVHDSSTLRIWWQKEKEAIDFYKAFPPKNDMILNQKEYTPQTAKYILSETAKSNSRYCIHPIQDFLGLSEKYYSENPEDERVNIPGSVNTFNWTYRLPVKVEELIKDKDLNHSILAISTLHSQA